MKLSQINSEQKNYVSIIAFVSGCLGGIITLGIICVLYLDQNAVSLAANVLRTRRHPVTQGLEIFGDLHVHGTVHSDEFLYQQTNSTPSPQTIFPVSPHTPVIE
jgi:hypothetical protein